MCPDVFVYVLIGWEKDCCSLYLSGEHIKKKGH